MVVLGGRRFLMSEVPLYSTLTSVSGTRPGVLIVRLSCVQYNHECVQYNYRVCPTLLVCPIDYTVASSSSFRIGEYDAPVPGMG